MKKVLCLAMCLMMAFALAACSSPAAEPTAEPTAEPAAEPTAAPTEEPAPAAEAIYNAGTYTGEGQGNNGKVAVEVTVDDTSIVSVTVTEHAETAGISDPAIERVPASIVEAQSVEVDTVSGATNTSNAIIAAVTAALEQAAK